MSILLSPVDIFRNRLSLRARKPIPNQISLTKNARLFSITDKLLIMKNLGARVAGTVAAFFGWLAFIVLYLAFYGTSFSFWQSLAIFIASGAIVIGIVAIVWIQWSIGH
jgi:uncharacterized membrane protein